MSLDDTKEALKAYEKAIELDPNNDSIHAKLGELYFLLGDLEKASRKVNETLAMNNKNTLALVIKGRIKIEEKKYDIAIKNLKKAICSDLGNSLPLLWNVYAEYLKVEFTSDIKAEKYYEETYKILRDREYQEGMAAIIRKLETLNESFEKVEDELRACILCFLGYFYYRNKDIHSAKEKLKECIRLESKREKKEETKSTIKIQARELLDSIWTYGTRPLWWNWWLSPFHCRRKISLICLLLSIIAFSVFHPFIPKFLPCIEIEWTVYIIFMVFLILALFSPGIQSFGAEGFKVELQSPSYLEPVLSTSAMEEKIKERQKLYNW